VLVLALVEDRGWIRGVFVDSGGIVQPSPMVEDMVSTILSPVWLGILVLLPLARFLVDF
jgi:hypothetical protein